MKKPNTIKIHKMLKEIYNMTQGGWLNKKSLASLETPQEKSSQIKSFWLGAIKTKDKTQQKNQIKMKKTALAMKEENQLAQLNWNSINFLVSHWEKRLEIRRILAENRKKGTRKKSHWSLSLVWNEKRFESIAMILPF